MKKILTAILITHFAIYPLAAQTIAEKKLGVTGGGTELNPEAQKKLNEVNAELALLHSQLQQIYKNAAESHKEGKDPETFRTLLEQANAIRKKINTLNNDWLDVARRSGEGEKYGLWQQPETTIEQLVIDYGSEDYVYLMIPEVANIKISVNSNLPIPRATWNEMLELILNHNGVGIRQLNPYLRELFLISNNNNSVRYIVSNIEDLDLFPQEERIAFLLTPEPSEAKRAVLFLNKFVNTSTTVIEPLGRDIVLIAPAHDLKELLKLYSFISKDHRGNDYKMIPLHKVKAQEMAKVLTAVFDQIGENPQQQRGKGPKDKKTFVSPEANSFRVVILEGISQAIFVIGTQEEIAKAEQLIHEIEGQIGGPREKVIYWYTVKNSNAEELAEVLSRIYVAMFNKMTGENKENNNKNSSEIDVNFSNADSIPPFTKIYSDTFYQDGDVLVDPTPISYGRRDDGRNQQKDIGSNFIVDPKTGSIVMVVEQDLLQPMKDVIYKLDIPKKMVQIEVLLVERATVDTRNIGLNLLRMGGVASNTKSTNLQWNDFSNPLTGSNGGQAGILDFTISRMKHDIWPAFDLAYRFLLMRDDIQINANPSILTLNQTTATFRLLEEISISTGAFTVPTQGDNSIKDSFTRAQYGINLEITPTIHMGNDSGKSDDDINYISLKTTVGFDTFRATSDSRPPITRRQIVNEVLIPDGQTVILGGLRDKNVQDTVEQVPFLGELPGLGKLFSMNASTDRNTEMFIFITPRIVSDICNDLEKVKEEQMTRRPGDIPDFMYCLRESRRIERERLFAGSIELLFGPDDECYFETEAPCRKPKYRGEWDGR